MRRLIPVGTALLLLALLLAPASDVAAHGYIVRAIPQDRATLERAPTRLQYWFSEALEPQFSTLNVRSSAGEIIATGGVSESDNNLMTVRLPDALPDGAYVVELRPAFASDGHVVAESRVFFVGAEVGGVGGQAATDQAIPLEVFWKALHYAASMTLFGAFTLYALVLVPAWGSDDYPAGRLPPRVIRRLNVVIGCALLVALIANGLGLIQQTMAFFNVGVAQALDWNLISLVRIGSRFGDIWNWRMLLLGIAGGMFLATLYFRREQPQIVYPTLAAAAWVMALVLGTSSILSHAAGSLMLPWVGIAVDWMHMLAVGLWAGGLVTLVLVMPVALRPYAGEARRLALLAVLRRFSRLALLMVVVVIATGLYSASNWVTNTESAGTTFGLALAVKLLLAGLLIAVGAGHHIALRPERYARWQAFIAPFRGLTRSLRLEAVLVMATLAGAAWLSATPVPVPEFAQMNPQAPRAMQKIGGLTVTMSVLPGGPGINTFDTTITRNGEPVEGAQVVQQSVFPSRDRRGPVHDLEPAEPGLYVAVTDDINQSGQWWSVLDITATDGETQRAAFEWTIRDEAAVVASVDPSPVQLAALLGVGLAFLLVVYPLARRGATYLQLDPATVTTALSVILLTVAVLVGTFWVLQEARQAYNAALEPEPAVVNTVLPVQASLEWGALLYEDRCAAWQEHPADLAALIDRLPRTRDEELFGAVQSGWRDLPPCAGDFTDAQTWDVVNYFRTLGTHEKSRT